MLILTRNTGETIVLFLPDSREIEVMATEHSGQATGIGINAPSDIKILRSELIEN